MAASRYGVCPGPSKMLWRAPWEYFNILKSLCNLQTLILLYKNVKHGSKKIASGVYCGISMSNYQVGGLQNTNRCVCALIQKLVQQIRAPQAKILTFLHLKSQVFCGKPMQTDQKFRLRRQIVCFGHQQKKRKKVILRIRMDCRIRNPSMPVGLESGVPAARRR